jgi:hypothetical protein
MVGRTIRTGSRRDTSKEITTPSRFGSHEVMVVDHMSVPEWNADMNLTLGEGEVLCRDDTHYYITSVDRLDTGLADPNRYGKKNELFIKE